MRIIAGKLGGRIFAAPKGYATHPMSEKARGGIFNALGDITGKIVLDAFAGSGALSFEAVSRGAKSALAIEKDFAAFKVLKSNIASLKLEVFMHPVRANNMSWSETSQSERFDLVICDPPYNHWRVAQIETLSKHVATDGVLVVSFPQKEVTPMVANFELIDRKGYGDAAIAFYRRAD